MKKIKYTLYLLITIIFVGCTDELTDIPNVLPPVTIYEENFNTAVNNTDLDITNWLNINEVGTVKWREKTFGTPLNGYAEINPFNSGNANCVSWLVSPELNAGDNASEEKRISFRISKFFLDLDSDDNSLKVFYTNNFDQNNLASVVWEPLEAKVPKKAASNYAFESSNIILENKTGNFRIGFKFKGNGLANSTLDGGFQVDDFKFFKYN